MKLFVGLGNPGEKYARHRHNVGFMAVERIAERHRFGPWKRKFQGVASDGEIAGEKVLLLKPDTYMNESGRAVGEAARFLKLGIADIVAFHDELDLAPGKLKVKTGGGNAGHNGLRSITQHVGNEFVRVRIGIGHPGAKELVHGWVLHDFAKADEVWLGPLLDALADCAPRLATGDQQRFLTDVARLIEPAKPDKTASVGRATDSKPSTTTANAPVPPPEPRPSPRGPHPAGERFGKRQNALAENLRKWMEGRGGKG